MQSLLPGLHSYTRTLVSAGAFCPLSFQYRFAAKEPNSLLERYGISKLLGNDSGLRIAGLFLLLQIALRQMPKRLILAFRLSGLLPKFVGSYSNMLVGWIRHGTLRVAST